MLSVTVLQVASELVLVLVLVLVVALVDGEYVVTVVAARRNEPAFCLAV